MRIRALSSVQALADRLWEAEVTVLCTDDGGSAVAQIAPVLADRRVSTPPTHYQCETFSLARPHACIACLVLGFHILKQAGRDHLMISFHSATQPHMAAHRLLDKSQLVRRKALQALDALSKRAPQADSSLHAVSAARSLLDAALPHLMAIVSAPPDSPLASDGAWQVRQNSSLFKSKARHITMLKRDALSHVAAVGQRLYVHDFGCSSAHVRI